MPKNLLDIGCGNGNLSLMAASLWPDARLTLSDINQAAVADATQAMQQAGYSPRAQVLRADGLNHPDILAAAPYDLIMCNLLAALHLRLATDVKAHLADGAIALLSGIFAWEREAILQAYSGLGLLPTHQLELGEWITLVFANSQLNFRNS